MPETAYHRRLGAVTVLERSPNLVWVVVADGEPLWAKPADLVVPSMAADLAAQRAEARAQLRCHDAFTAYLAARPEEVYIYFSYPAHATAALEAILAELGQAGVEHRPMRLGLRGGQAGLAGARTYRFKVCLKRPADLSVLPRDVRCRVMPLTVDINDTAYAIELAKAFGFRLTNHEPRVSQGHRW